MYAIYIYTFIYICKYIMYSTYDMKHNICIYYRKRDRDRERIIINVYIYTYVRFHKEHVCTV